MANLLVPGVMVLVAVWMTVAQVPAPPQLDLNEWWGPNEYRGKTNTTIRPFKVRFYPEMVNDLKYRLKNHRKFAPPLEGIAFEYGFNTKQIEPWVKYWAEEYNFEQRQAFFNKFQNYKTNIQGLDIHFVRVKPQVPEGMRIVPLLMLHGFRGSIREFYDVIPFLTQPNFEYDYVFEVIAPSLPGFGFSDPAVRPGMGPAQMGIILKNLMNRLGHYQFYMHAGDMGAIIGSTMVTLFQDEVLGYHTVFQLILNSCYETKTLAGALSAAQDTSSRVHPSERFIEEAGYIYLQATKPDTIGVGLTDSPSGFLAYMFEKYSTFTRVENLGKPDGGLFEHLSKNQLIDNLMVYWMTNSITSSMRMYAETLSKRQRGLRIHEFSTSVPTWVLHPLYDLFDQPTNRQKFTNVFGDTALYGGHYLAMELSQPFAADIFKAVKTFMRYSK